MRAFSIGVIILMVGTTLGHAETLQKVWPKLTSVVVDDAGGGTVQILYNPNIAKVINFEVVNKDPKVLRVMEARLSSDSKETYIIEYDAGPSGDPGFVLYKQKDRNFTEVFRQWGLILAIPGDGFLYIAGHTNNMYDQRKKFELRKGRFVEVVQPYYYVGMKSKLLESVVLYSNHKQQGIVAKLPKGTPIEVILNQGEYYLIKTNFGLLGWLKEETKDVQTQMEGIFFAGD